MVKDGIFVIHKDYEMSSQWCTKNHILYSNAIDKTWIFSENSCGNFFMVESIEISIWIEYFKPPIGKSCT